MTGGLLAVVLTAQLADAAEQVRRHALLVGANDGGPERTELRYAHDDARTMAQVLTGIGGVDDGDADLLLDPDTAALDAAFAALAAEITAEGGRAEVVFYYSGHSDEDGLLLGGELYPYRDLRARLDTMPARVRVAILDSCASGAMIRAKGGRKVPPFLADESTEIGGFAYITSSSEDEVAQEAERIGGSYFTHYLASGLRGAADRSQDGRVTLTEAYSFAYDETLARTERTQHGPQHAAYDIQLSGSGDLVLTDLSLVDATLVLAEGLEGQVLVRDEDGALIAETQAPGTRSVELALGAGNYEVTVVSGTGRYAVADLVIASGGQAVLEPEGLSWHLGEVAVARGDARIEPPTAILGPADPDEEPLSPDARNPARFGLLPGVPDTPPAGTDTLVIAAIAERSRALDGIGFAMGAYAVDGLAAGGVGALGATTVGELSGIQASLGVNVAQRGGDGLQGTVGANLAYGGFDGIQSSVGLNVAEGGIRGAQLGTGANLAPGGVEGLQLAAGANVAGRLARGWQVAAGFNVAQDLVGLQASMVNVARDVDGLQLGLINVGRDVDGVQFGLINVARDVDGMPIGLLSFVKEGRHDLLLSVSETDLANLELKLGGDYLYTSLGGGWSPDRHGYFSMGLGGHAPFGRWLWLDLDASVAGYLPLGEVVTRTGGLAGPFDQPPTGVVRGRLTLGIQALPELAPFAGLSVNGRIPTDQQVLLDVAPTWMADGDPVTVWAGAFAGVQF